MVGFEPLPHGRARGGDGVEGREVVTAQLHLQRLGVLLEEPSLGDAIVGLARVAELALEEAGVSLTQYRVLQHLQHGHTIQSDLAFRLSVTKQSATRLVDTLVEKRYLTRREDPEDRRRVIHAITPNGHRALARADAIIERYLMLVLQDLDDDAEIQAARKGIQLFAFAARASYERVQPDGIIPGPRSPNRRR